MKDPNNGQVTAEHLRNGGYDNARYNAELDKVSFEQRPALMASLLRQGLITQKQYDGSHGIWSQENLFVEQKRRENAAAAERERLLSSLSPAERLAYEQREQELALQHQAQRQRARELSAYEQRTRALSESVNVNVSGTVDHRVRGSIYNY